jgi:integrase
LGVPRGLKPVRRRLASGEVRTYWYHRATGKRLKNDPHTAAGMLEAKDLDDRANAIGAAQKAATGTIASLWHDYRQSPEWRGLKPRTRSDYQSVRDWLGPAGEHAVLRSISAKQVIALRDRAFKAKGRRFANYVVQVLRMLFGWGKLRGHLDDNPANGVPSIRRPTDARIVNRPWSAEEVAAFARGCPFQLLVPFALALFASMRQGDAVAVTRRAYNGRAITWVAGKNGQEQTAPVTGVFKAILDLAVEKATGAAAPQLALTSNVTAWTQNGLRASFFKRVAALQAEGLIKPGATFHGLRHTIATLASNDGESDRRVAAAIGDKSPAMAQIYAREADRQGAQAAILEAVQKRFENIDWKTPLENGPKAPRLAGAEKGKKA